MSVKFLYSNYMRKVCLAFFAMLFIACSGLTDLGLEGDSSSSSVNKGTVPGVVDVSDPKFLTGVDGATTVNTAGTVLNNYCILAADAAAGATSVSCTSRANLNNYPSATLYGNLAAGDLLMIHQAQGATIDTTDTTSYGNVTALNNAGRYEFVSVASLGAGQSINLASALQFSYTAAAHVQIVRVPQLTTLTITSPGTLTAPAWNGTRGGIVAISAQSTITNNNIITASNLGFRGGAVTAVTSTLGSPPLIYRSTADADGAEKGEGIAGYQTEYGTLNGKYGRGAPANGGGGGNGYNAGGGGGANGNSGTTWTGQGVMSGSVTGAAAWALDPGYIANGNALTTSSGGGRGGYSVAQTNQNALTVGPGNAAWGYDFRTEVGGLGGRSVANDIAGGRIYFGGGGGAGDANAQAAGGQGGIGGGIVFLIANSVAGSGSITANGQAGGTPVSPFNDSAGGGGAGGTIVIKAPLSLTGLSSIAANGGTGGNNNITTAVTYAAGGGGGGGYISTSTTSVTKSATGALGGVSTSTSVTEFPSNGATSGASGEPSIAFTSFPYGPATNDISVTFSTSSQTVSEGTASTTITVTQNNVSTLNTSIPFTVTGTATGGGTDYSITASPVTINAGATSATITITINNDALDEDDETVIVTMGTPTNAIQGTTTVHTATITDNDPTPTVQFTAASQSAAESAGTMTVTAQLSAVSGRDVTVPYTVTGTATGSGTDYSITASPITITAGSSTASATITINNDSLDEANETVIVTMGSPTNATASGTTAHTATINDNDPTPTVQFTAASQSGAESVGTMTVTAQLSAASGLDVTVPYTLSGTATGGGTDYSITASPITITAGSTTASATITVTNDAIDENDETVIVTMGTPTNATASGTTAHTATINDNDATPSVQWTASSQSGAESVGTMTVTAQLSAASGLDVDVPYTLTGTATGSGTDYSVTASPITITAGSTTATVTLTIVDDALDESNETIIVTMGTPTNASQGATTVHTATVNDNDPTPNVTFTSSSQSGAESVGTFTVTAQLSAVSGRDVTVPYTLTGTASDPGDYTITASPITITAGSSSATITITVVDDSLDENNETVIVTMGSPTNANQGATTVHTATINDNDATPSVTFTSSSQSASESTATMTITAQLSAASGLNVDVPYTLTGTATGSGTDYSITASPVTITAGSTSTTITITVTNDALDENNETVIVTMGSPTNASQGATTVHTATINDDDATPSVTFTSSSQSSSEATATMTITAQLSAASGLNVDVPYTLTGTATGSGTDYSITASPVTITAGSTTTTITITVTNDALDENNETVIVTMGSPTNASQGATTVHTATINDDDATPSVTFTSSSQSSSEATATMTITAQLSAASGLNVDVPYTLTGTATGSGTDYSITASPVTITAGSTSTTITITVTNDALDENNETVIVTMGTPTNASQGATTVHTATINDDDATPSVTFTSSSQSASESTATMTITAQLSAASGLNVDVPYTLTGTATGGGTDYSITASPVTITAGSTSTTITITVTNDALDENNETVIVTMGSPTNASQGATTVHTATINDDDATPSVTFSASSQSASEATSTMTITAQLSAASGLNIDVPYTLTGTATGSGTDYSITASPVTITAGSTSTTITITVVNDALDENNETVIVTMGSPTNASQGATTVHTATINDDDAAPSVTFTSSSQNGAESVGTFTVTAQLSAASGLNVDVPYTLTGTATGGGTDYSITASPVTITAGSTSTTITITVTNDALDENNETVIVTMGTPTNASQGATTVHTATINDDDATPDVTFTSASQSGAEDVGTMTITAQLSAASGLNVTVPFTVGGSASDPADYAITASPITINAGSTTATITITVVDDSIDESSETVVVTMGSPTNASQGATTVHTATVTDNDATPDVTFTASSQSASESTATMTITAQLSAASGLNVTVPFTVSGTASDPADYSITASPVTITAGSTSTTITITVSNDALDENNETVIVTMGTPTNASQGATIVHTATINDNDATPDVTFTSASQSAGEGAGTMTITAQLSAASGLNVTVPFGVGGSASDPADYAITATPVTITAGSTSTTITISMVDDALDENNETVIVTMGSPTNATQGATTVHTATINDNDATPDVTFTSASQNAGEGTGTMTITAQLSAASGLNVTVPFSVSGTASDPADYAITASPVTITAGSTSTTITISMVDDALDENNETVIVTMGSPTNATQGATTVHTATINDNDATPDVTFTSASQNAGEGTGTMTITAQLSAASGLNVTVPFSVSGTASDPADYSITATPVTITAGSTSTTITISMVDDALDEPGETVVVTMGSPTNASQGAITVHTATINDDDATPDVTFTSASQSAGEGAGTMTITAQLSAASGLNVTVPFTVSGTASDPADYSITATPVTITAGSTSTTITISMVDDALDESAESVIVTMGSPTNASQGATTVHTATINDDDATPDVTFTSASQNAGEGAGTMTITAQLSAASGLNVTVPFGVGGSASDPADYSITSSPITINAGSTTATITISMVDDALDENNETVVVTMGSPTNASQGATTVHTATINDDDATPSVTFTSASQSGAEDVGTMTITAQLSAASGLNVTVPFTVGGSASDPADYAITASPVTINAGSTTSTITITVVDDSIDESSETVVVTMGSPTNATQGATTVHTATINDNDATPTVEWTAAIQNGAEDVGTMTITAQLSAASGLNVTVPFGVGGSASDPADYSITASPITITAGATTSTVTISVVDDATNEGDETVIVTMGSPTNASAGATTVHTATINDNDTQPIVQWTVASQSGAESVGTLTITAELSDPTALDVTIPYTVTGTASDPADYSITASPIVILAGGTTGSVTITVAEDALDENAESVIVTMGSPTNANLGTTTFHTATINDNDPTPSVEFTSASQSGAEDVGTMTITAQLSAVSGRDVTVPYTVTGTASNPADYTITGSPITISAGSTTATITINVADDSINEVSETIIVTMGAPTHATQGGTTVHTATVTDNDAAPSVEFTAASQSANENAGTMTITAQLSAASGLNVTVPFSVSGSASDPADYSITASPITINAGSTTATITISVVDDAIDENNENVIVTMGTPTNASAGATTVHTATITDNDAAPSVEFTSASQSANENAGTMTITAQLSAASGLNVTVPFTVGGSASDPTDYSITASPITINAGSTTATITISVVDDAIDENAETVSMTMGSPTNASAGATTVHVATINDNDATPTVEFTSASQNGAEDAGTMTITAQLSAASGLNVTVPYVVTGSASNPADYAITASPITIHAGSTTATITITVVDDSLHENSETVIATMGVPTNASVGATTVHTATITDNDSAPTVDFAASSQNVGEGAGTATITVNLSSASGLDVTVPFTMSGTAGDPADYSITSSPITILAGATSGTITVSVVDDAIDENDETVIVTMGGPTNASAGVTTVDTVTIQDNDSAPTVDFAASTQNVGEGAGTATITVNLSAASGLDVTVPFTMSGTASDPADYSITSSPITILAGATSGTITVNVVDDAIDENDETVIVTMGGPTNASAGSTTVDTVTIQDNDSAPTVEFTSASQSGAENVGTMTITAQLDAVSGLNVTVPFSLSGTSSDPADYSITASPITINAGSTTATITISVVNDAIDEDDETVIVTMGAPTNASQGATTVHTATIQDNDATPTVEFDVSSQSANEGDGTATITVNLSAASGLNVTVPFSLSGTAADPDDYSITASPVTILAGATSANITITIADDGIDETSETVVATMGAPTHATQGATTVDTVTIADNDATPSATFTSATQSGAEDVGTMTITAQLSAASGLNVTIPFTMSGTASDPADYSITSSPVTINAGSTTATITISVVDDAVAENSETIVVTMGAPTNATQGATIVHTATITDNEPQPSVEFTASSQSVGENAGTATITAQLDAVSGLDVIVPFTIGGTASDPADYLITASPITIPAGSTTATITVNIVNDVLDENNETVIVNMGVPTNATQGATTSHTLTITDNDPTPTVQFATSTQSAGEGAGTATVTVNVSAASGLDITVPFTISGTSSDPADYTITSSPILIPAGSTSGTITVTIVNDSVDENDETVIVTMGVPTNASAGATTVDTVTITDNDATPTVQFSAASQSIGEGAGTFNIVVQLSAASGLDVTVPYVLSGSATDPADYSITASPITILAGSTSANIVVTLVDDGLDEGGENIIATMGVPTNATQGATTVQTVSLIDNDGPPSVSWTTSSQSAGENAGSMTITAQLSATSGLDVTVPFTMTGTASDPADYSITASPITILAGDTTATITITIVNDAIDEDDETVIVTMGSPTNAIQGVTTVHTATVTDNDAAPTVEFTSSSQSAGENAGSMTITAQLSGVSGLDVVVPYSITGTASDPADYAITTSPITILAGSTTATITIAIVNDTLDENDETVVATMGVPTNASAGATTVHTATITDNDSAPTVQFTASTQGDVESAGSITVTVQLSAVSGLNVTVPFGVSGTAMDPSDYAITASPITILAGSTSTSITISIVNDAVDESDETVIVTMGVPTNASAGATTVDTVTITDDDSAPTVEFTSASQSTGEGAGTTTITAQLSTVSGLNVTIPLSLSGSASNPADYTLSGASITILAGATTGTVTVNIVDDALDENSETVAVTMGVPTNATAGAVNAHTLTITDNDAAPAVEFTSASQSGAESVGTMTITAQLDAVSGLNVTVPFSLSGTAGSPADYSITATPITINAGSTTATITISVVNDALDESDEDVVVTMGLPTNATQGATVVHTATITDNDAAPTVQFTSSTESGVESVGTITVTAQLSAVSGLNVTVPFSLSGTAIDPTDYTITASPITIPAGSTSASITISVVGDAIDESNETVIVTMGAPTNASAGATTVDTVTITDDDSAPAVEFTSASQSGAESVGTMTITAQLDAVSGLNVSVPFTLSGSATGSGTDYSITASPVTILAGSTSATITISVVNDVIDENNETVIVTMGVPTNASAGATTVHTATITDNDVAPTVEFTSASQSAAENAGTMTITAQLDAVSGLNVSIPFTLSGSATGSGTDYSITASPVTILAGSTSTTITISIVNDALDENDEDVVVTMGVPTNASAGSTTAHTATITDNDAAPTVTFTSASQSAGENIGSMTITAQISAVSGLNVTVPFTLSGTAVDPADYTITASPITIAAGLTSATITIAVVNDALDENNETVVATMGVPTNASAGATTVHTATINDNDAAPSVTFTSSSQSVGEGAGSMTVTAQISAVSGLDVTVPYTMSGSATDPADYTITASPITILAGATSATITVSMVDDAIDESSETVVVTMGSPTNATTGATTVHTATITDNDAAPSIEFTSASQSAAEGAGTMTITAQLSSVSGLNVTLPFSVSGTATGATDYSITSSPVTILAGATTATITINMVNDALDENDETVIATMGVPTNATAGATNVHTATISDDDSAPTVQWTAATQSAAEGAGSMTITAQLSAVSGLNITIPFTMGGTASSPADYTITASPITILAGSTTATVTITMINDTLDENDETVVATIGVPTNATAGATTVHTATINDNDSAPTVQWAASTQSGGESAGTMTITAQLSAASGLNVSVPFTMTGTGSNPPDYTNTASPITINAGSTTASITLTIVDDALDESNETVIATMGLPTNASAGAITIHTATIVDNDVAPTVTFTSGSQSGAETVGSMTVTAVLSAVSGLNVSVPFGVSGTASNPGDYSISASPVTITAGSLSATITINVVNDASGEPSETVIVTMGAPTNATQGAITIHTATITDDDAATSDTDGDGLGDLEEDYPGVDTDGDGTPDYLDFDSDNDGIPDVIEFGLAVYDTNGNGVLSAAEITASGLDGDTNNILSIVEIGGFPDHDADGTPDFRDLDSDNDGVTDLEEAELRVYDADLDHHIDASEYGEIDNSALPDVSGGAHDNNTVFNADELPDFDGDGVADYIDGDSDSDGIPDIVENGRYICDANGDGFMGYPAEISGCSATDTDGDGFLQNSELTISDRDSDTTPDYVDFDSDGDGIADLIEGYAADADTNVDGFISDAEYAAAVATIGDNDSTLDRNELVDTDGDTTPDMYDMDSDGDKIRDLHESDKVNGDYSASTIIFIRNVSNLFDTDGDATPDFRDTDSDDDGILDSVESGDNSLTTVPVDSDNDNTPNFQDTDSDGDELLDADEVTLGTDPTDNDSDGDGAKDGCEVFGNTAGCLYDDVINVSWYPGMGSVGSPITDPNDSDTDDGGTNDFLEAQAGTNPMAGFGADDPFHSEDTDGDGLTNDEEVSIGTNPNDADSDNDGVKDGCEVLGNTSGCSYDDQSWFPGAGSIGSPITDPLDSDSDNDGLEDGFEVSTTDTDPRIADTDGDGLNDGKEHNIGTHPLDQDTDNDGLNDGVEVNTYNTDPLNKDTDGDGLDDGKEVNSYDTNPIVKDTDKGGIPDGVEVDRGTNPLNPDDDCPSTLDSDKDGLNDCEEIDRGLDPLDEGDVTVQGSGTSGLFGVGCRSNSSSDGLWIMLLIVFVSLTVLRRKNELG